MQLPCNWTWTDGDGVLQRDTAEIVLVDRRASSNSLIAFYGCGNGPTTSSPLQTPAPDVQFNTAWDTLCLSNAPIIHSEGKPPGGTYAGPGVTGNTFTPAAAGIGEHTFKYSFSDGSRTGCARA